MDAITGAQVGQVVDEDDLEAELESMQQEQLDEQMLKTGTVPVADSISRMPNVPNGAGESRPGSRRRRSGRRLTYKPVTAKSKAPVQEEDDEEAELRKLQAEMAM